MDAAPPRAARAPDRAVAAWLFTTAAFVAAMVVVGGLTRLTRSGLSIVEWKPLVGALPPIGDAAWAEEFARYQATPEYRLVNAGMSLDGFRQIFWVEWAHRLLGRVTGVVFALPLVVFAKKRRVSARQVAAWVGLFALGGVQGAVGWYMVKSGLVDEPHVSPYRLTAHLSVALVLFALLVWSGLDALGAPAGERPTRAATRLATAALAAVSCAIVWGGLMAGHHAGLVAPTFPTMNGAFVPPGLGATSPLVLDPLSNVVTVHFVHRALAYVAALVALAAGASVLASPGSRRAKSAALALVALVGGQIALGALTVLGRVPIALASLHQTNAVLVLGAAVALVHALARVEASRAIRS